MTLELQGVAVNTLPGPGDRSPEPLQPLLETASAPLQDAHPDLCLGQAKERKVHAEPVVFPGRARAGRRSKIVYRLTADGKERLQELLGEGGPATWEDDGFGVHFAFFGLTRADVRLRILEGRRSRLEERMEAIRAAFTRTRERVDSYTLELHRHGLESVEREVRWLNELIASERQAGEHGDISEKEHPDG